MWDDANGMSIHRFDSVLYQWIDTDDSNSLQLLISDYPQLLGLLGKSLFQSNDTDSTVFFTKLKKYYSEPTLKNLYKDAITLYDAHSPATRPIEQELSYGFTRMKELFPSIQIPAVYMHVSGLQQNMIVADSLLSISIDKYLGDSYPLYAKFFYPYQRKNMLPACAAKDGLYAWLSSEYPFIEKERTLLNKMIYEGKMLYVLTQTGYNYSLQQMMQWTDKEYQWCQKNEAIVWKTLQANKLLYSADELTVSKFFSPAPSTFFSGEAPGNMGNFIGYRIVASYMKQTKASIEALMTNNNAQEILKTSKYKP